MAKPRIQVYADPETKRRIELAAAKYNDKRLYNAVAEKLSWVNWVGNYPLPGNGQSEA